MSNGGLCFTGCAFRSITREIFRYYREILNIIIIIIITTNVTATIFKGQKIRERRLKETHFLLHTLEKQIQYMKFHANLLNENAFDAGSHMDEP